MRYLFGDYVLDTQRAELHGAGAPIKLRRKVLQVLVYLLAHRDRVVLQARTPRAPVARPVCRGRGAENLYHDAAQGAWGAGAGPAFRAHAARPGLSLCGGSRGAGAPPGGRRCRPPCRATRGEDATHQAEAPSPALAPPLADLGSTPVEVHDGEHKQLTVLCGALAEVPSLTARLGPEAPVSPAAQAWLALVQEVVQHYDGTLTLSPGGGLTGAVWGPSGAGGPCAAGRAGGVSTCGSAARPPCPSTPPETAVRR